MKNQTLKLFFLSFILISGAANAQEKEKDEKKTIESQEAKTDGQSEEKIKKNSLAIYAGLPGFALGYGRLLNNHFSMRLNGALFSYKQSFDNVTLGTRKVNVGADFNYRAIDLLLDYQPFKKSSFKLVGGLSYLIKTETTIVVEAASDAKYGNIVLTKDQIGNININADWSGIAPYIATGFGRTIPKHNFGFGFEIGGHFVGKSDFTFEATKTLLPTEEIENESHDFQSWIDQITFIPTVMFHLNHKF